MRSTFIYFIVLLFLMACNSSSENTENTQPTNEEPTVEKQAEEPKKDFGKIAQLKVGMSGEEVIEFMG